MALCAALMVHNTTGAQAQSQQCYSSSGGYSCTNYGSNGQVTSVSNCTNDGQGNVTCTNSSPGSAPSASVCIQNTCGSTTGTLGSQCYSSSSGYSCTNYGANGQAASSSNCTNDGKGNVTCVNKSPGSAPTVSVCLEGTCGPAGEGGQVGNGTLDAATAASQRPSISMQRCSLPGRGTVWVPSQTHTGQLVLC